MLSVFIVSVFIVFIVNVFSVFIESVFIANVKFKADCNSTYLSQKEKKKPPQKNSSDIGNVKFNADCNSIFTSQPICHRDT